ncbi:MULTISPECIES: helix-turn-helix transcriptional regulator [Catenuloplanes]|uniref:DNA-binding CsgD family transcriptional regulator n=1 Tax=Catenuloplanes niger TaxID=587534 RepID=A0AAE3ZKN3_9ACTN|nr:AAA family ATPase [Catenuloplanes niger]MDR7320702.1 DNA-binding CsgD family transcriptional regulator [Catenuloplanes niger]
MRRRALLGRDEERRVLAALVDQAVAGSGGAVVVLGAPGIGKSALVAEAAAQAASSGIRVLTAVGVESEEHVACAGLHQLVHQLRDGIDALPGPQRAALRAAVGLVDEAVPDLYLVGLAALTLLSDAAAKAPLLVIVEDAHWMDQASLDVFGFVGRRIESDPLVMVAVARDTDDRLGCAGVPVLHLEPLTDEVSGELLDAVAPGLGQHVRQRLLAEAAGNPLALTELPAALRSVGGVYALTPAPLPLTERLERTFTARVSRLPVDTRAVLLLAALNGDGTMDECLAAAARMLARPVDVGALGPAVGAGLVEGRGMAFRHPLVRSALHHAASAAERQAAHAALAVALEGQPDRQAWHRAAATAGPDERAARDLDSTAGRALRRGGVAAALAALTRAAELTEDPSARADRLLRAAELALESGRVDVVAHLLARARSLDLSVRDRGRAAWVAVVRGEWARGEGVATAELAELAVEIAAGEPLLGLRMLWGAMLHCYYGEPGPAARQRVAAAADRMPVDADTPYLVALRAYCAPVERGQAVMESLTRQLDRSSEDTEGDQLLGGAAVTVGAPALASRLTARPMDALRAQGQLSILARALCVQAGAAARLGNVRAGQLAAEEAAELTRETGQPLLHAMVNAIRAQLAAVCGDPQAEVWAAKAEGAALPGGVRPVLAIVQTARGHAALCQGRYGDAFGHLHRVFDPADPAFHPWLRFYAVAELAESAVRSESAEAARAILAELAPLEVLTPVPALLCGLRLARALLSPPDLAEPLYRAALDAVPADWPFERARVHLALGEWLRRNRRPAESRAVLQAAREVFDALGASAWSERARQELRTAGASSPGQDPDAVDQLTPTELHVAQLAAQGLTNREIGERLYVSPRTVSTHLQRMFPKLGVTSRGELATVLRGPMTYAEDVV